MIDIILQKRKGKTSPENNPATLTFQHAGTKRYTSPPCIFFMLKPSLPFFPFLFFFFLQQHFLIIQKQQVRMSSAATTAMAIRAHGGTVGPKTTEAQLRLTLVFFTLNKTDFFCQINSILNLSRKWPCTVALLTWDFIDFI